MIIRNKTITIFGGTGFLGRYVVKELADLGCRINVVTRNQEKAADLKVGLSLGQLNIIQGDVTDSQFVESIVQQSDILINLIGCLFERHIGEFAKLHAQFPELLAQLAKKHQLLQLIHISALGVGLNEYSLYAATKLSGENAIKENFDNHVILRPSVMFGHEDHFINQFANISAISPIIPLLLGGRTKFQPVYVHDIARAIAKIVQTDKYNERIYEIGGPNIYTMRKMTEMILDILQQKRLLVSIPLKLSLLLGNILGRFPNPKLTSDQVKMLMADNVTQSNSATFYDLSVQPQSLDDLLPELLTRHQNPSYHNS
ncbi:MAG: complex I NDUFA9 subunit family protein [Rickettsiales bacterium]|nr:complex I NDUFA9 subunit family protein [Rickettsiales bacterium]